MAFEDQSDLDRLEESKSFLSMQLAISRFGSWFFGAVFALLVVDIILSETSTFGDHGNLAIAVGGVTFVGALGILRFAGSRSKLFAEFEQYAENALQIGSSGKLREVINDLELRADIHPYLGASLDYFRPLLSNHLESLLDSEARQAREDRIAQLCREAEEFVRAATKRQHESRPEVRAKLQLEKAIPRLRKMARDADRQFDEALSKKTLKWWAQWTRDRGPIVEIENQIAALEIALEKLKGSSSLAAAEADFDELQRIVVQRLAKAKEAASRAIPDSHRVAFEPDHALSIGLMIGIGSAPISAALDLDQAEQVYDALRRVNSNFAEMSDFEIWLESLSMPAESLLGLSSLTKGSYFETLVEQETGGVLHANFNHPETDIEIDGVLYQIKGTPDSSYVDSVADHIPVITTMEGAEGTDAIPVNVSDAELTEAIDLALGGTMIDFTDTVLDGLTAGLGGVGIIAILGGAHAAWTNYQKSGNALDALSTGLETTAMNAARSAVNLAELLYRAGGAVVSYVWKQLRRERGASQNEVELTAYWAEDAAESTIKVSAKEWKEIKAGAQCQKVASSDYEGQSYDVMWSFASGEVTIDGEDGRQCVVGLPVEELILNPIS